MEKYFKDCTTIEEIKKTYKRLAFKYHTDKQDNNNNNNNDNTNFILLNDAYKEAINKLNNSNKYTVKRNINILQLLKNNKIQLPYCSKPVEIDELKPSYLVESDISDKINIELSIEPHKTKDYLLFIHNNKLLLRSEKKEFILSGFDLDKDLIIKCEKKGLYYLNEVKIYNYEIYLKYI